MFPVLLKFLLHSTARNMIVSPGLKFNQIYYSAGETLDAIKITCKQNLRFV